eukprot:TRINITY_DN13836_c0_g1_i1.p1 TRINITY_DN13836_c0_g1~~TRINITY_DN13836_c0_g1_i1.p1  ORF type:complete len:1141 (+),score=355.54 TRINITY_DN13836_c0_g1_i1:114-3536(+)
MAALDGAAVVGVHPLASWTVPGSPSARLETAPVFMLTRSPGFLPSPDGKAQHRPQGRSPRRPGTGTAAASRAATPSACADSLFSSAASPLPRRLSPLCKRKGPLPGPGPPEGASRTFFSRSRRARQPQEALSFGARMSVTATVPLPQLLSKLDEAADLDQWADLPGPNVDWARVAAGMATCSAVDHAQAPAPALPPLCAHASEPRGVCSRWAAYHQVLEAPAATPAALAELRQRSQEICREFAAAAQAAVRQLVQTLAAGKPAPAGFAAGARTADAAVFERRGCRLVVALSPAAAKTFGLELSALRRASAAPPSGTLLHTPLACAVSHRGFTAFCSALLPPQLGVVPAHQAAAWECDHWSRVLLARAPVRLCADGRAYITDCADALLPFVAPAGARVRGEALAQLPPDSLRANDPGRMSHVLYGPVPPIDDRPTALPAIQREVERQPPAVRLVFCLLRRHELLRLERNTTALQDGFTPQLLVGELHGHGLNVRSLPLLLEILEGQCTGLCPPRPRDTHNAEEEYLGKRWHAGDLGGVARAVRVELAARAFKEILGAWLRGLRSSFTTEFRLLALTALQALCLPSGPMHRELWEQHIAAAIRLKCGMAASALVSYSNTSSGHLLPRACDVCHLRLPEPWTQRRPWVPLATVNSLRPSDITFLAGVNKGWEGPAPPLQAAPAVPARTAASPEPRGSGETPSQQAEAQREQDDAEARRKAQDGQLQALQQAYGERSVVLLPALRRLVHTLSHAATIPSEKRAERLGAAAERCWLRSIAILACHAWGGRTDAPGMTPTFGLRGQGTPCTLLPPPDPALTVAELELPPPDAAMACLPPAAACGLADHPPAQQAKGGSSRPAADAAAPAARPPDEWLAAGRHRAALLVVQEIACMVEWFHTVGRYKDATQVGEKLLALRRAIRRSEPGASGSNLAAADAETDLQDIGQRLSLLEQHNMYREALELFDILVRRTEAAYGDLHPRALAAHERRAGFLLKMKEYGAAAETLSLLAERAWRARRVAESEHFLRMALQYRIKHNGPGSAEELMQRLEVARMLIAQSRYTEVLQEAGEAEEACGATLARLPSAEGMLDEQQRAARAELQAARRQARALHAEALTRLYRTKDTQAAAAEFPAGTVVFEPFAQR